MKFLKFLKNPKVILVLIIVLATALRIINLANWPISFNQDEALNGYEAYSILKTGHDHRGNPWPVFFEGFSDRVDNRLPLYIYSSVPFVAVFGLNKFAVRLPSVIFGLLTILFTYFLAKELFKKEKVALLACFFLAVSPWHIFLSRIAHEVITLPFFSVLTIFFFLKGTKGRKPFFLLVGVSLALLLYTYHVAKLFAPLLGIVLIIIYWKKIREKIGWVLASCLFFLMTAFPLLYLQFSQWGHIQSNFNLVSVFTRPLWPALLIFNFFVYLDLKSLFTHYPFFVIISLFFVICFFKKLIRQKEIKLIFVLLLISLLPAILTMPNPHPTRPAPIIPFIEIIAAFGLWQVLNKIKETGVILNLKKIFFLAGFFLFLAFLNLIFLFKNGYPYNFAPSIFPYDEKPPEDSFNKFYQGVPGEVISFVKENQDKYDKIVFTDKVNQFYIFFLFYLKYPPEKFQSIEIKRKYLVGGWESVTSFDKYRFCDINQCYSEKENNLYIARANEVPHLKEKKVFYNIDGSVFRIITND